MAKKIERRSFLKTTGAAVAGAALFSNLGDSQAQAETPAQKSKVYFSKDLSYEGLLALYAKVNQGMSGKIGIKLHTGEPNGPNLLPIDFIKGLQAEIPNSNIVECNVLYPSTRQNADTHRQTIATNGFDFCPVDIMDEDGDAMLPIAGMQEIIEAQGSGSESVKLTEGQHYAEVAVGKNLLNYDSLLVYTHFKGHAMGGFGGSLKNIAIGCASGKVGKRMIHGDDWVRGPLFLERMVEAGKGITDHFGEKITYINVLKNISVDCDCDAHGAPPSCSDIGILASTDILAIDQASVDMIYAMPKKDKRAMVVRIESRQGLHQLTHMKALGMGNADYELINI
nr:DUF362 domain-containing protein [uncultured Cohaesibacter sp.]